MTTGSLTIRPERRADAPAIRTVHEQAFGRPDEADLVDTLREDPSYVAELSIVAELDGDIVAHVLFTVGGIEGRRGLAPALILAPVAVRPDHQGKGIGTFLIERAIATCKQAGRADFIVLVGHPAYYPRFGFVRADTFGVTASFARRPEAVMLLKIGFLTPEPGEIRLPEPFERID